MRPSTIVANTENLFLEPRYRGCSILKDVLNRTVLWRVGDALALSEDPPIDNVTIFVQNPGLDWKSIAWMLRVCFKTWGRVFCYDLEEYFRHGRLGKGYIGMTILDVFVEDSDAIMSNKRWLISECNFPNGPSLQTTIDHFSCLSSDVDPQEFLGERQKATYRFIVRKSNGTYNTKTADSEVRKVSFERCCSKHCS